MQQYAVNQYQINQLLSWVQAGEIAVPEIQRPFVWSTIQVRDLLDSLYQGYPIGYIIIWKNPDVRLKDGSLSSGKKVLIDGQQRITALTASMLGNEVVDKEYKTKRIKIAFHPVEEKFETLTPAIEKNSSWISDVSELLKTDATLLQAVHDYCEKNPDVPQSLVEKNITRLMDIKNKQVGVIDLEAGLDIETVTEIFIRINSKGVVLSQADFAMSKIASYDAEDQFGVNLRKCIDYFAHLAREPKYFKQVSENDVEFAKTHYLQKLAWLQNENDDLYDPDYGDILRVSFTKVFERGKMSELVGLLSGRNFETRTFEQEIMDESFKRLESGVLDFINETHFKRFLMIIKSAGFIDKTLVRSQNTLNFAYALYLKLRDENVPDSQIEGYVRRWFVMSILTGRYSGSPESTIDSDIKSISKNGIEKTLSDIIASDLSDAFWKAGLISDLGKATINSPSLKVFFAAQVYAKDKGFLSEGITVSSLIEHRGDIHHLFPKEYLRKMYTSRNDYNQIANFVYAQSEINIHIGKKAPSEYMKEVYEQCDGGKTKYGGITDINILKENLAMHCIPEGFENMSLDEYPEFLSERRKLMAQKMEFYFNSL